MSSSQYFNSTPPRAATQQGDVRFLSLQGNGRDANQSPLKIFGQAKKKINEIFKDLGAYIDESITFVSGIGPEHEGLQEATPVDVLRDRRGVVEGIASVVTRDRMKVAFFGRTSNGKSTVINAMLKDKILPSGIGHTTHCFVQVEGTDGEPCLMQEGHDQPQNIQSISQLASALSEMKLEERALIRILWPKKKCTLLREDVVFVDSPGIDVSPDLDSWIDKFCMDADVFVLVANAESTLMQTEKNFFHKVNSRLSRPNVFILQNRWDASAGEDAAHMVQKQHMERNTEFLHRELRVVDSPAEAEHRIFFVSAKEALINRVHSERGTPTPERALSEGHLGRLVDFTRFEEEFQKCISHSAVKTKFAQHTEKALKLSAEVRSMMETLLDKAVEASASSLQRRGELSEKVVFMSSRLRELTQEVKDKINDMTEKVELKVSRALVEEIRRLAVLVDEFERPFHPDALVLQHYKKELHTYVEQGLGRNLQAKCSSTLTQAVEETEEDMKEQLANLLPEESKQNLMNALPRRDFQIAYRLDCRNLCADFQESIEFRFSLGVRCLVQRFLGARGASRVLGGGGEPIPAPMPAATPQTPHGRGAGEGDNNAELIAALASTFSSVTSTYTVATVAITGVMARAIGWRVLAVGAAVYGLVYVYERLMWTNKTRERVFKRQYVDYASSRLKLIVDLTSASCSHQVQQELSATFARLCREVDAFRQELEAEAETQEAAGSRLDQIATTARSLRNRAQYLDTELRRFERQFLAEDEHTALVE